MSRLLPILMASTLCGGLHPAHAAPKVVTVEVREGEGHMLFAPDRLEIAKGQAVRFVVHNGGALAHEFVVGTRDANRAHAKMMARMPGMTHHESNAIELDPGTTRRLSWRFDRVGEFEFACLVPGHYQAGMHGTIVVR